MAILEDERSFPDGEEKEGSKWVSRLKNLPMRTLWIEKF
jgi:hypothetical protein